MKIKEFTEENLFSADLGLDERGISNLAWIEMTFLSPVPSGRSLFLHTCSWATPPFR